MKQWFELVDLIAPPIVKIESPRGHGTGFLCGYNADRTLAAIATARHVVEEADKWQQPIRIHNVAAGKTILLQEPDRVIIPDPLKDSAIIAIFTPQMQTLQLPDQPIQFIESGKHLRVGVEVAWLGYPGFGPDTLCFFSGMTSAWQEAKFAYLIDGVAINGVSGGPVFRRTVDSAEIIGSITAYQPNFQMSGTLPGLSIAQDVSHFQDFVMRMKNREEAARKKKEQELLQLQVTEAPQGTAPSEPKSN
jgi:hypothetical protein